MSTWATLSQDEAFARIRLLRSPNVGPVTYAQLLARFGDAQAAIEALPDLAGRAGKPYSAAPPEHIHEEIAAVRKAGARYLFHDSAGYPPLLAAIEGAPPVLTVRGDAGLFAVVSGLARGIDGAAHEGALAAGEGGSTIGVIASGIDVAYPPQHAALQERIAQEGLLIAEQPPGTEPLARNFPTRNRIIAGLAVGTLVVEAAPKSGSLITARLAGEMGREVMAVPGSPLDARSHGCNQLIRDGAVLVQSVEDVAELLSSFGGAPRPMPSRPMPPGRALVREEDGEGIVDDSPVSVAGLLTSAPVSVDELIRQSGASASAVQLALLELEIAGRLVRHAAGRVSLA
ncbi:MAG: DNA-processing protein DprA [Novosphingobium sp.]